MSAAAETKVVDKFESALRGTSYLLNYFTRAFLQKSGLTLPRFWALLNLARQERTTMGELQERLLISPGSVTTLIDGLVHDGLVVRERSEEDRRLVLLVLSPSGAEVLEKVMSFRTTLLQEALAAAGEEGQELTGAMIEVLERVFNYLENTVHAMREDK